MNVGNLELEPNESNKGFLFAFLHLITGLLEHCHAPDREQTLQRVDAAFEEILAEMKRENAPETKVQIYDGMRSLCLRIVELNYAPDKSVMIKDLNDADALQALIIETWKQLRTDKARPPRKRRSAKTT